MSYSSFGIFRANGSSGAQGRADSCGKRPTTVASSPEPAELLLPQCYGEDRIALMPQSPFTLYCYWEVTPALLRRYGVRDDCETFLLRFCGSSDSGIDADVEGIAGSTYANLPTGGGAWFVELHAPDGNGGSVRVLVSEKIELPPAGMSDIEITGRSESEGRPKQHDREPEDPPEFTARHCTTGAFSSFLFSSASMRRAR